MFISELNVLEDSSFALAICLLRANDGSGQTVAIFANKRHLK